MVDLAARLYHAVDNDDCQEIQDLIELGVDLNQFYDDFSHSHSKAILHFACAKGRKDCVKILLDNGALVNVKDKWRMTPIMYCVSTGNDDIINMLTQKFPEAINSQDTNGRSALHFSVEYGSETTVKLLLEKGADVNIQDNDGYTPLMTLLAKKENKHYLTLMKILHKNGSDVHITDFRDKRTPLHSLIPMLHRC